MNIRRLHSWTLDPSAARRIQDSLVPRLRTAPVSQPAETVAGADVSFDRARGLVFAAVLVFRFADLELIEEAWAHGPADFPYVPGLLSFREGPVMLKAFARLRTVPNVVLFDGQGIAHPRRLGLAAHMGLWLDLPTIGCAKSRLIGDYEEPGPQRGDAAPLMDGDEQIGEVLRTRDRVKPLFVSPGHRADFPSSRRIVLECGRGLRLPEPTRQAHIAVTRRKRDLVRR
jgi:deoxyribonuclease V